MFNSAWYKNLIKPEFSPPDWVFAPVWIVLYILIFISLALYINSDCTNKKPGYIFFIVQMCLNFLWPFAFFGLKSISSGLIVIVILDIFLFLTVIKFFQISKPAGIILIPYLLWVLFATYSNIEYLILN